MKYEGGKRVSFEVKYLIKEERGGNKKKTTVLLKSFECEILNSAMLWYETVWNDLF